MRNDSWFLNIFITLLWDRLSNEHQIPRRKNPSRKGWGLLSANSNISHLPKKKPPSRWKEVSPSRDPQKHVAWLFCAFVFFFSQTHKQFEFPFIVSSRFAPLFPPISKHARKLLFTVPLYGPVLMCSYVDKSGEGARRGSNLSSGESWSKFAEGIGDWIPSLKREREREREARESGKPSLRAIASGSWTESISWNLAAYRVVRCEQLVLKRQWFNLAGYQPPLYGQESVC